MDYEDIYQQFVGKDKVQPLKVCEGVDGMWILRYKEGQKVYEISCENREFLDRALVEFGGKNPETCRAPDQFMEMGTWLSEDLNELGHAIQKVKFSGQRVVRSKNIPILFPKSCGHSMIVNARKRMEENSFNLRLKDTERLDFTLSFKNPSEFDALIKFLKNHDSLGELKWIVMLLGTEARETRDQCVWKRLKAGDGTKRMVLELIGLNGQHYTDCVRQDLYNAAGDMFYSPCRRVAMKKKKEHVEEICMFAAEDGKIDMSIYEGPIEPK
ncbi:MAG: hypothetical protein JSV83_00195 [Desulfobacterales bacterium]|nr:MAG: hypothetical protein JSV83_00195 [Desulfobacterales bacterium]